MVQSAAGSGESVAGLSAAAAAAQQDFEEELQLHYAVYGALGLSMLAINQWQAGVVKWQVKVWKQMKASMDQVCVGGGEGGGQVYLRG